MTTSHWQGLKQGQERLQLSVDGLWGSRRSRLFQSALQPIPRLSAQPAPLQLQASQGLLHRLFGATGQILPARFQLPPQLLPVQALSSAIDGI
jgi:hypothetical protein